MEEKVSKKSKSKLFIILGAIAIAVIGVVVALILILGNKKGLAGKWVSSGNWYYVFINEEEGGYYGSDTYEVPDQPFNYTDNGDSITIQFKGMVTKADIKYRIEGDKLTMINDNFGSEVVYTRSNE